MPVGGIASRAQLRMSFLRWAVVTVPAIVLLGFLSGRSVAAGDDSAWYVALSKPAFTPPGWVFPVAWTILYVLMGLAVAMILNARGARGRGRALAVFALQLAMNLAWTPLFFGEHKVGAALALLVAILVCAAISAWLFARIRVQAAWLMLPYLAWLCFAGALNFEIDRMNPDAETLAPGTTTSQIIG